MAIYKVKFGQSIYDIAIQVYGSVLGVYYLLQDNENLNLSDSLPQGTELSVYPTSDTILDKDILDFFANREIINSETVQKLSTLKSSGDFGTIFTSNIRQQLYINSSVWRKKNQIYLSNSENDRVLLSNKLTLNSNEDQVDFTIKYDDIVSSTKWILFGDSTSENAGAYISVDSTTNKVSLYDDTQSLLIESSLVIENGQDIDIKVRCELIVTDVITKDYYLDVNGTEDSSLDVGNKDVSFDTLGGFVASEVGIGDGYSGYFKYLEYNGSEYEFSEGKGKYTYKN